VDNERNKTIHIRIGDSIFRAGKSGPNGHFFTDLVLTNDQIEAIGESAVGRLRFTAVLAADDRRKFAGEIELIEPRGLSVISDVDDTIKISEVADRRALLANTFLREYKPVDGMSELYQKWQEQGARFHYVSASPWQLYGPMSDFLAAFKFPAGSLGMKMFRLHDRSALDLLATQHKYKPEVIGKILADFPLRRFVLVGDSGEQDPEIYGELARKYPERVVRILIRHVGAAEGVEARYGAAFKDIPHERWQVFAEPADLPSWRSFTSK
jgi:phosphatidate phosphatase APP1